MGRPRDGSDRELQRSSIPGELGKPIDRRVQHLRSEHAGAHGVIALGNLDVPDLLLPHGAHGGGGSTTLSRRFRRCAQAERRYSGRTWPGIRRNTPLKARGLTSPTRPSYARPPPFRNAMSSMLGGEATHLVSNLLETPCLQSDGLRLAGGR